jgi:hypothetical protein
MIVCIHFPSYLDRWREYFTVDSSMTFFALLFEYVDQHRFSPIDGRSEKLRCLVDHAMIGRLMERPVIPDWFVLLRYLVSYFADFGRFYVFMGEFRAAALDRSVFSQFYNFFGLLLQEGFLTMTACDEDFIKVKLSIFVEIAGVAIEPPYNSSAIECACLVFAEIFDFSPQFLVRLRHHAFVQEVFSTLNASLPTLCEEPSQLIELLVKVGAALRLTLCALRGSSVWHDLLASLIHLSTSILKHGRTSRRYSLVCHRRPVALSQRTVCSSRSHEPMTR